MIYRDFQGLKLSGLGLGMMRLPTVEGQNAVIDEEATGQIIDLAYRSGINYFDTAWGYHGGNSELMAGKFLTRYPRESYYLATKFPGFTRENMLNAREIFPKQLEKCGVDYFDFYLLHNVCERNIDDYLDPACGLMDYLLEQKAAGRIRHMGFSCHGDLDTLRRLLDAYGDHMEFCQLEINYLDWHFQHADEKVALLNQRNIPVWIMEPVRGGMLAAVSEETGDFLRSLRPQETVPGWAFRFTQSVPGVGVVLSGMSSLDQLRDNLKTWETDQPLTPDEFTALVDHADRRTGEIGVPCTACYYCTANCPQGLSIPDFMRAYTEYKLSGGTFTATMVVNAQPEGKRPQDCLSCGACEAVCPQHIPIPQVLADLSDVLSKEQS